MKFVKKFNNKPLLSNFYIRNYKIMHQNGES